MADKGENNKENANGEIPILFFIILVGIVVALIGIDFYRGQRDMLNINASYIALALIGVVFHLVKQFRIRRDQGGFSWHKYKYDYIFRAFQAVIYIVIIDNTVSKNNTEFAGQMALIALFVGMYIRKVEEAFENLGDRFRDTLRGILGATATRLTPAEKRTKLVNLRNQLNALSKKYDHIKQKVEEGKRKEIGDKIMKANDFIQKGNINSAEKILIDLNLQIMDPSLTK